ncbi:hypothetical protein M433DRAFT_469880 [Acidomyces richmondensis BFW]|nr:hypothetical protein M433DRAFT_469880 [Acidomyces richmondensis BFW]
MDEFSVEHAKQKDEMDTLHHFRNQFFIPSKADLARQTLKASPDGEPSDNQPCIYLCGNSLGLQPVLTRSYMQRYLDTWATKGVYGHFKEIGDSNLVPWLHVDEDIVEDMANIVGAIPSEIAMMQTLTANLHLMMASFYQPTSERYKIVLEGKAFPSDHYAVESHIRHHGLNPMDTMVLIEPNSKSSPVLSTKYVLSVIDEHASSTALLLLPGIQFYTGQYFDIPTITSYAQSKGIIVGWDLAHAVGNVPTKLHEWNVDFAVWCTYKYMNCGPGAIGGCFVHQRHGLVEESGQDSSGKPTFKYRTRLSGWWGSSKSSRFAMTNQFHPIAGAAGFQLSNPSVSDLTAVRASLDVFKQTNMEALREKSIALTRYLEDALDKLWKQQEETARPCFTVITPRNPEERGAQLSILLQPGLLDSVMQSLEAAGVVVDERHPDVIRVAPAPLYNSFQDVAMFVQEFSKACTEARLSSNHMSPSVGT